MAPHDGLVVLEIWDMTDAGVTASLAAQGSGHCDAALTYGTLRHTHRMVSVLLTVCLSRPVAPTAACSGHALRTWMSHSSFGSCIRMLLIWPFCSHFHFIPGPPRLLFDCLGKEKPQNGKLWDTMENFQFQLQRPLGGSPEVLLSAVRFFLVYCNLRPRPP